jgi:hypothetical protein
MMAHIKSYSSTVGIGGAIEIHGRGSGRARNAGGRNWTLGCIALSDSDMDILFGLVGEGTRVTIVRCGADALFGE